MVMELIFFSMKTRTNQTHICDPKSALKATLFDSKKFYTFVSADNDMYSYSLMCLHYKFYKCAEKYCRCTTYAILNMLSAFRFHKIQVAHAHNM